ncbi:MAG: hypothetical protein GY953_44720 [bacterium]|nr:hypothetical protein [bacterium]
MNSRRCAMMLALSLSLAGCGGGGNAPAEDSAAGERGAANASGKIDACAIITQDDATKLFGKPASPDKGTPVVDPNMLGECLWTWDSETSNHLLQFRVWRGDQYYSAMPESQPIDFAATGYIRTHPVVGVDMGWIQDGKTVSLTYSTVGADVPEAQTKAEEVRQLALKVEARL